MPFNDEFLTEEELATALGIAVKTLRNKAARRQGPPRIRAGHTIMYRKEAIAAWLKSHEVTMTEPSNRRARAHSDAASCA